MRQQQPARSTGAVSSTRTCSKCDHGWVFTDANTVRPCECRLQQRTERLFQASRITKAFRAKTFANFTTSSRPQPVQRMYKAAQNYANTFGDLLGAEQNWLVLLGTPGAGKTHLSMAVCNQLLDMGIATLYLPYLDFIKELRDAVGTDRDMGPSIDHAKRVSLLYIDDLFKGRSSDARGTRLPAPTQFVLETITEIIYYRYLETLPTIVNSEWLPDQLQRLDAGLARRIIERGAGHMVTVDDYKANFSLYGGGRQ